MRRFKTLTTVELAERWGLNPGTLANWRYHKRGPVHIKIGTEVRYRLADVLAYERANEIKPRAPHP